MAVGSVPQQRTGRGRIDDGLGIIGAKQAALVALVATASTKHVCVMLRATLATHAQVTQVMLNVQMVFVVGRNDSAYVNVTTVARMGLGVTAQQGRGWSWTWRGGHMCMRYGERTDSGADREQQVGHGQRHRPPAHNLRRNGCTWA